MASSTIKKIVPSSVGAVAKSGDTMTGALNVLDDIYAGSSTFTGQLNIVAKSDKGEYMLYSNGSTQSNSGAKGLYVKNSEGTGTSVILTDDSNNSTFYGNATGTAANVTGIVAVDHGGTNATTPAAARANLEITPTNIGAHPAATTLIVTNNTNYTGTPSDSISKPMAQVTDTNNFIRHQTYGVYSKYGNSYTYLSVRKPGTNGGDPVANEIAVGFDANGNKTYSITDTAAFRNTLGATSGLWPVTLGGTGATTPATARTNLEITPANIGAKATQTAVSSPTASGTASAFIDTISQDAQGVISVTKKTVASASQSAAGLMSSSDKTKLDGIATGAQVNSITGVKGNAESSYRTGNVNLTPENIGAHQAGKNLVISSTSSYSGTVSSAVATNMVQIKDTSSATTPIRHQIYGSYDTDGYTTTHFAARIPASGSTASVSNEINASVNSSGVRKYYVSDPKAFRSAIEAPAVLELDSNSWSTIYGVLSKIPLKSAAVVNCTSAFMGKVDINGSYTGRFRGIVSTTSNNGDYDFFVSGGAANATQYLYSFRLSSFTSSSATPTINMQGKIKFDA